jgi:hypothetical protein
VPQSGVGSPAHVPETRRGCAQYIKYVFNQIDMSKFRTGAFVMIRTKPARIYFCVRYFTVNNVTNSRQKIDIFHGDIDDPDGIPTALTELPTAGPSIGPARRLSRGRIGARASSDPQVQVYEIDF